MIGLNSIYYEIRGIANGNEYTLCYSSSPSHAIKQYIKTGWEIDQLKVIPMLKENHE